MIRVAVPALLLLVGLTSVDAAQKKPDPDMAKIERQLSGLKAGEPVSCIRRDQADQMMTADGVILYVVGKNRAYRNDIVGHCSGLAHDDIVVTKSVSAQLCDGDIIETRSRTGGMFTGSCSLGEFVPYSK